jgi:acetyl-CoA carboxylase biotin carboxyl carrier protein
VELKQIKELMAAMERAGIKKISLKETSGFELLMEREDASPPPSASYPAVVHREHVVHAHPPIPRQEVFGEEKQEEKPGKYVTSPMVGTLYAAPSPDDPPFVKVGDKIDEQTVVCIIEAMKLMNEVKAGISGTVAEILVDNARPVEFGTKILRIV